MMDEKLLLMKGMFTIKMEIQLIITIDSIISIL